MRRRSRLGLLAGTLIVMGLLAAVPAERAGAVCFGTGCHGLDPIFQGCTAWAQDGAKYPLNPDLYVKVRKSLACGGVKWAWAERYSGYNGQTFKVWLADANGNALPGSEYVTTSGLQIYSDMWTGPVKACTSVAGYLNGQVRCTPVDY
jgi:hypothetical protein